MRVSRSLVDLANIPLIPLQPEEQYKQLKANPSELLPPVKVAEIDKLLASSPLQKVVLELKKDQIKPGTLKNEIDSLESLLASTFKDKFRFDLPKQQHLNLVELLTQRKQDTSDGKRSEPKDAEYEQIL